MSRMRWTREEFEQDKTRYQAELDVLLAQGLPEGHPLVERQRRRIETVDRVLTDPAYGLVEGDTGSTPSQGGAS